MTGDCMGIEGLSDDAQLVSGIAGELPGTAMTSILSSIASLLLGYAVLIIGNGLLGTLISLRMIHEHVPSVVVGMVQSAYYIGFMLGALWGGSLIARIGHHRAFAAFAAVATCAALGYAVTSRPLMFACLRFVTGFCLVGIFTVMESWLQAAASNRFRGRVFSVYLITTYLGVGAGQFLINLAPPTGFELFSLVGGLFAASLVPVTLTRIRIIETGSHTQKSKLGLGLAGLHIIRRLAPLGLWGCLAAGLLNSVFYALYPVFMRNVGYSVAAVSNFMGFALIAALLPQWPIAYLSDRFDRRWILLGVSILLALSSLALFLFRDDRLLELVGYLYVSLIFTVYGLSITHGNDCVQPAQRVAVSAGLLLIFAFGGITGPIAASLVMGCIGPKGIYMFTMAVTVILTVLILRSLVTYGTHSQPG